MAQTLNLKCSGLYTAPNPFSGAPDGALVQANDIVIDQTNLAQPRRGFNALTGALPLNSDRLNRMDYYGGLTDTKSYLVGQWGSGKFGYYNNSNVWTAYSGTFNPPDSVLARTRFLQQNNGLFFTTANGIYKLASVENDTPRTAGVPPGLDIQLALTGATGFMTTNTVGSFVGTVTSGSAIITGLSALPGNIAVGQYISDAGAFFAAGTTVSSITQAALAATTTSSTTTADLAGQTTLHVASTAGLVAGQIVSDFTGTLIQSGTTVSSVGVGLVVLSLAIKVATATATPVAVVFTSAPTITLSANASGGAPTSETITYSSGSQVAYRLLLGYKDANNNLLLGAPTQWVAITNTNGATTNVQVTSSLPAGLTTAYFYQVYRTFETATASVTPPDEMQLCYAASITSTDISNGYVQFTDSLIAALLGTSLYTSPSQQGIGQAYTPPPFAKDFCSFSGYTLYANVTYQQTLSLTMIGVGSPTGVQSGDIITIGGITFTGGAAQNIATNTFKVFTTGTPAQNITNTTNSLVQVINRSATSTVYAYATSGPTSLPGMMLLSSRTYAQAAFAVTATQHTSISAYSPSLPTSGTTVSSTQVTYQNGVVASVINQPEAAPAANLLPLIGQASAPIYRIIALRNYVVVLKADGVFRIVGNSLSNFQVLPFDYTTKLVAPDSAVSLNNQVWCLANQGVVSISDTGVQQQSWTNINDIINSLFGTAYSAVQQYATAVAYETDHKYILGIPTGPGDGANTQTYTYNIFTSAWTRWTREFSVGFVHPTQNILYLGNSQNNTVVSERKTLTYQDFIDEAEATPTISSVDSTGYILTLTSVTNLNVGDLIYQDSSHFAVITALSTTSLTATVNALVSWTLGAVTVYPAIVNQIQWKPIVAGNPGFLRQCTEGDFLFSSSQFTTAQVGFYTDISQNYEYVNLTGTQLGDWGLFQWGNIPWGDYPLPVPMRFLIPLNKQCCSQLNVQLQIQQAYANWALSGVNIVYNDISQELAG